jgi:TolB-like protein
MSQTRRLAAILAADVAGYSRLMGADEEGTLERLKALRRELVDPKIAEHHGRVVKTTGDGLLVEFASVVDALRCAVEVQHEMTGRNAGTPPGNRIELRIGINVGDIVVEDGDIFGDGVNVAARLEALAEPGSICVSARVQEDAAGKLDLTFRDLGEQQLKNITRPVRAYAVGAGPRAQGSAASTQQVPRLSIVVLPFANLSNDPDQQYFADGLTEDLTTDLSRIPGMLVISRNTAFTYRDRSTSTRQIGRELGVRYVMEGSVRRSANRVRVTIQLIDADSDAHLWADRFDRDLGDFFELQDEVTVQIARALDVELTAAEAARTVEHLDCLDCLLRGRAAFRKPRSRVHSDEQIGWFERALALDPRSADAQMWLAIALATRALDFVPSSSDADIERAEGLARQALAASPRSAIAHQVMGQVLRVQRRYAEAISEYEAALTLDRNRLGALADIGWC